MGAVGIAVAFVADADPIFAFFVAVAGSWCGIDTGGLADFMAFFIVTDGGRAGGTFWLENAETGGGTFIVVCGALAIAVTGSCTTGAFEALFAGVACFVFK